MLFDKREKCLQIRGSIYQFNDDREIFRQPFDLEGMNDTSIGSESHEAAKDRGSCEPLRFSLCDDPFIERLVLILITLADVNPK